jgi:hypothetical protein
MSNGKSSKAKSSWDAVVDRWKSKTLSNEAWRNADSSLIPEYVPPRSSGSMRKIANDAAKADLQRLREFAGKSQKGIRGLGRK